MKTETSRSGKKRVLDLVLDAVPRVTTGKTKLRLNVEAGAGGHGSAPSRANHGQRQVGLGIFGVLKACWPQQTGQTFHCAVPETGSILSRETIPELTGRYAYETLHISPEGTKVSFYNRAVAAKAGDQEVAEWPNSTAVRYFGRELVLPRAVHPFTNKIDLETGVFNAPENYVSDVPLMERIGDKTVYLKTLLRSIPGKILFEDPRISTLHLAPNADPIVLLSFTEYLPAKGIIQNRAVILERDADGTFKVPEVDEDGRPRRIVNFSPSGIDAKNGTLYANDDGEIVLRSRMRGFDLCPSYAEQVWVFESFEHFLAYQGSWAGWHDDLAEGLKSKDGNIAPSPDRVRPLRASIVATETSFPEFYPADQLAVKKEAGVESHYRGFGPGTRPMRLERVGDRLYFSEGPFSEKRFAGSIPKDLLDRFVVPDGEARALTFDHQLRLLELDVDGAKLPRRVYTGSFKLWNAAADKIELIYADALQPVTPSSRGGGIPDLEHVYPEGWVDVPGATPADPSRVALYCGVADASTERIVLDLVTLLSEMSEGSTRRQGEHQVGPPLDGELTPGLRTRPRPYRRDRGTRSPS